MLCRDEGQAAGVSNPIGAYMRVRDEQDEQREDFLALEDLVNLLQLRPEADLGRADDDLGAVFALDLLGL